MKKRWKVVAIVATALVIVLAVTGVVLAQSPWSDGSSAGGSRPGARQPGGNHRYLGDVRRAGRLSGRPPKPMRPSSRRPPAT